MLSPNQWAGSWACSGQFSFFPPPRWGEGFKLALGWLQYRADFGIVIQRLAHQALVAEAACSASAFPPIISEAQLVITWPIASGWCGFKGRDWLGCHCALSWGATASWHSCEPDIRLSTIPPDVCLDGSSLTKCLVIVKPHLLSHLSS